MKKFLLGIAMLLTAGFTFAQDNFVISPSSYAMTFDINNPDAKVEKEFTVVMNVSEPESYRAGLIFITIPQGLELVSYSSRSDIWHKAIGCWSSGELADVVVDLVDRMVARQAHLAGVDHAGRDRLELLDRDVDVREVDCHV